jgi:SAM-dependent MidA family methyltransferase
LVERQVGGWHEIRVSRVGAELIELSVPVDEPTAAQLAALAPGALPGARMALQDAAADWLRRATAAIHRGAVVAIDYTTESQVMVGRPQQDWLRTYRSHERGRGPLDDPGAQDITVEVAVDQLARVRPPSRRTSQAGWLFELGLEQLVEDGRRIWAEQAAYPGIEAMRARSRVAEAAALADPGGLGAFEVMEWELP